MTGKAANSEFVVPVGNHLARVRSHAPRVHCIVNEAAIALTANVLLAAGAKPSMTSDPWEVLPFVSTANSLSINLGMLTDAKRRAIRSAVKNTLDSGIPWVLDPALIDRSDSRLNFCRQLLHYRPRVIRGNKSEIDALCSSLDNSREQICSKNDTVLVVTGAVDEIVSSNQTESMESGHEWMEHTTGMGCALSALMAALLTVFEDSFDAAVETLRIYGSAGQQASEIARGPGTFVQHFIDCMHNGASG